MQGQEIEGVDHRCIETEQIGLFQGTGREVQQILDRQVQLEQFLNRADRTLDIDQIEQAQGSPDQPLVSRNREIQRGLEHDPEQGIEEDGFLGVDVDQCRSHRQGRDVIASCRRRRRDLALPEHEEIGFLGRDRHLQGVEIGDGSSRTECPALEVVIPGLDTQGIGVGAGNGKSILFSRRYGNGLGCIQVIDGGQGRCIGNRLQMSARLEEIAQIHRQQGSSQGQREPDGGHDADGAALWRNSGAGTAHGLKQQKSEKARGAFSGCRSRCPGSG